MSAVERAKGTGAKRRRAMMRRYFASDAGKIAASSASGRYSSSSDEEKLSAARSRSAATGRYVSKREAIAAAKGLVEINKKRGRTTSERIRKLAAQELSDQ